MPATHAPDRSGQSITGFDDMRPAPLMPLVDPASGACAARRPPVRAFCGNVIFLQKIQEGGTDQRPRPAFSPGLALTTAN